MLLAIGHNFLLNLNVPRDFTTDWSLGCHSLRCSMFKLHCQVINNLDTNRVVIKKRYNLPTAYWLTQLA